MHSDYTSHYYAILSCLRGLRRAGTRQQRRAGLSPAHRRHAHAGQRLLQDPGRRLVVPLRERRRRRARWAATAFSAPGRFCAFRRTAAARAASEQPPSGGRTARRRSSNTPIRCGCWKRSWPLYRAPHLPGLPRFCGGAVGYAGYDAVRYVERLPNPPPDDRQSARPLLRLLRPHGHLRPHQQDHRRGGPRPCRSAATCGGSYDAACARVDRLVERLQQGVADLQLTDIAPVGEVQSALSLQLRAGGVRGRRREVQGIHQGRRHLSGGAQPAACRPRRRPGPSTFIAPCAWSIPVRSCSTSRPARSAWSAARRRSWCASRATA